MTCCRVCRDLRRVGRKPVGELISAQARATPDAIALVAGDRQLTYAQLESESQRAAQLLTARGIGPGKRVGVRLPRSIDLATTILGVWKTGATYVALNTQDSAEQTERQTAACGASFVVILQAVRRCRQRGLQQQCTPWQSPAAVWFTDDAVPVEVSHSALLSTLSGLQSRIGARSADVFLPLGLASASTLPVELFQALTSGARVVLPTGNETSSASDLQHLVKRAHVTRILIDLRPSVPRQSRNCSHVHVGMGTAILCRGFGMRFGPPRATSARSAPARRPLPNTGFRVLDETLKSPPIGAKGELYIGGNIGTIDESAAADRGRFIFVSGGGGADERLFKTGNSARVRADGIVEIIDERPAPETEATPLHKPEPKPKSIRRWSNV